MKDADWLVEVPDCEPEDDTELDELKMFGSRFNIEEGAEEDVDRSVELADSELEDVTNPDELEIFGSKFNVEAGEEERGEKGVEVVDQDCVGKADEVFDTVIRDVKLEDDVRTEAYDEIEDEEVDFDDDLEEDRRELDDKGPEGEEVQVDVDGDKKELEELDDESAEGEEVRINVNRDEEELGMIEYRFSLNGAPQSSNGFPAHLTIRLAPYIAQIVIFKI
jgi:hypothetical protein